MSVYSTLLFIGNLPSGFATLYTVPSGYTVVIRDVECQNISSGNVSFAIYVSASGSSAYFINQSALTPNTTFQWKGRLVLPAAGTIGAVGPGANEVSVAISGYLLQ